MKTRQQKIEYLKSIVKGKPLQVNLQNAKVYFQVSSTPDTYEVEGKMYSESEMKTIQEQAGRNFIMFE